MASKHSGDANDPAASPKHKSHSRRGPNQSSQSSSSAQSTPGPEIMIEASPSQDAVTALVSDHKKKKKASSSQMSSSPDHKTTKKKKKESSEAKVSSAIPQSDSDEYGAGGLADDEDPLMKTQSKSQRRMGSSRSLSASVHPSLSSSVASGDSTNLAADDSLVGKKSSSKTRKKKKKTSDDDSGYANDSDGGGAALASREPPLSSSSRVVSPRLQGGLPSAKSGTAISSSSALGSPSKPTATPSDNNLGLTTSSSSNGQPISPKGMHVDMRHLSSDCLETGASSSRHSTTASGATAAQPSSSSSSSSSSRRSQSRMPLPDDLTSSARGDAAKRQSPMAYARPQPGGSPYQSPLSHSSHDSASSAQELRSGSFIRGPNPSMYRDRSGTAGASSGPAPGVASSECSGEIGTLASLRAAYRTSAATSSSSSAISPPSAAAAATADSPSLHERRLSSGGLARAETRSDTLTRGGPEVSGPPSPFAGHPAMRSGSMIVPRQTVGGGGGGGGGSSLGLLAELARSPPMAIPSPRGDRSAVDKSTGSAFNTMAAMMAVEMGPMSASPASSSSGATSMSARLLKAKSTVNERQVADFNRGRLTGLARSPAAVAAAVSLAARRGDTSASDVTESSSDSDDYSSDTNSESQPGALGRSRVSSVESEGGVDGTHGAALALLSVGSRVRRSSGSDRSSGEESHEYSPVVRHRSNTDDEATSPTNTGMLPLPSSLGTTSSSLTQSATSPNALVSRNRVQSYGPSSKRLHARALIDGGSSSGGLGFSSGGSALDSGSESESLGYSSGDRVERASGLRKASVTAGSSHMSSRGGIQSDAEAEDDSGDDSDTLFPMAMLQPLTARSVVAVKRFGQLVLPALNLDIAAASSSVASPQWAQKRDFSDDRWLTEQLLDPSFDMVRRLFAAEKQERDSLARALVLLFEKESETVRLLEFLVSEETDRYLDQECLDITTVFRQDSPATAVLSQFAQVSAMDFVRSLLQDVVADAFSPKKKSHTYEIEPRKLQRNASGQLKGNVKRLRALCTSVLDVLLVSVTSFPRQVRFCAYFVMRSLRRIQEHFRGGDNASAHSSNTDILGGPEGAAPLAHALFTDPVATGIGGFVFLRLVCPMMVSPATLGITPEQLRTTGQNAMRGLILTAKLVQMLANGLLFPEDAAQSNGTQELNDLLRLYRERMLAFLLELPLEPLPTILPQRLDTSAEELSEAFQVVRSVAWKYRSQFDDLLHESEGSSRG